MRRSFHMIATLGCSLLLCACQAAGPGGWWQHVSADHASQVQAQLRAGADPNAINPQGQPAIMQAIRDGAWDVYDVLASDRRTNVNATNKHDETALMYLAVTGQTRRAQALIRRGADVNRLGWTPLQYAASTGKLDTVKMLIANKALVNAPAPDGSTALMMAARAGSDDVVQYLLQAGADATMVNLEKMDAADWARLKGHEGLAETLDARSRKVVAQREAQRRANAASQTKTGDTSDPSPDASANIVAPAHGWQGGGLMGDGTHGRLIPGTGGALNGSDAPASPPPAPVPHPRATGAAEDGGGKASSSGSNSGYFDLDRFNRPDGS